MARTHGARQVMPTDAEIKAFTAQLKEQANQGDTNAKGWLVLLNAFKAGHVPFQVINGQIVETRG